MWGDGGAGFAFGVRLGFGVGVGFAFGLGAIALGLVDLAVRGFAVLGVAALRLMDFLDVFRFAMSPPGVWLLVGIVVRWGMLALVAYMRKSRTCFKHTKCVSGQMKNRAAVTLSLSRRKIADRSRRPDGFQ
jgi:hypothetical protein